MVNSCRHKDYQCICTPCDVKFATKNIRWSNPDAGDVGSLRLHGRLQQGSFYLMTGREEGSKLLDPAGILLYMAVYNRAVFI